MAQTSMKRSELESLGEGERIFVGCKEVELGDPISTHEFLAGTCFDSGEAGGNTDVGVGSSKSQLSLPASPNLAGNRPFKTPMTNHTAHDNVKASSFKSGTTKIYQLVKVVCETVVSILSPLRQFG